MSDTTSKRDHAGSNLESIYGKYGPWNYTTPPVSPSKTHAVFYQIDSVDLKNPPKPYSNSEKLYWDNDHVYMPFNEKNLFPVKDDRGKKILKSRWEIIQTSLLQPIANSRELEAVIGSYNMKLPKLLTLHRFFEEELNEDECKHFFEILLPGIINLALRLPEILPRSIPLLKQGMQRSISLSQFQIASLLANAFLCTFPWKKEMAASYPGINFSRLFAMCPGSKRDTAIANKLKCICNYFKRILIKNPVGVITFERKYLPKSQFPRWDRQENNLGNTKVLVCNSGKIEDTKGLLQVDFADKYVGGGVIGFGCVQEETLFLIYPELIVSKLFTECFNSNEALTVTGVERYNNYEGYKESFIWTGNYDDKTPFDSYGRRRTNIVAIDATRFKISADQFSSAMILRDLNKAYVGFYSRHSEPLPAVSTGNWGCGVFKGNPHLKFLIQLMACSAAKRDMVYFTFEDDGLKDSIYKMHMFLATNQITIAKLWRYLCAFAESKLPGTDLFSYIQQAHFDSKKQNSLLNFVTKPKKVSEEMPSTSLQSSKMTEEKQTGVKSTSRRSSHWISSEIELLKDTSCTTGNIEMKSLSQESEDDVIESSQSEELQVNLYFDDYKSNDLNMDNRQKKKRTESQHLIDLFESLEGKVESKGLEDSSLLLKIDEFSSKIQREKVNDDKTKGLDKEPEQIEEKMEIDEMVVEKKQQEKYGNRSSPSKNDKPKKKITDFFSKIDKG